MLEQSGIIMVALALFAVKHFLADFVFQPVWMQRGKGIYGNPGGFAHAGVHMLGSVPALVVLGAGPLAILALILTEGVAHYHIDWTKERLVRRAGLTPAQSRFWMLLGADQALHQLTYLAMVTLAVQLAL